MTHAAGGRIDGPDRVVGALGVVLGVALVGLLMASANRNSVALVSLVMVAVAVGCPVVLGRPAWRSAGVGILVGMAGAYTAVFALLALWIAGVGPG
jgi:hypothetical protein